MCDASAVNPLLQSWSDRLALPPFEALHASHFPEAFQVTMRQHTAEIETIAASAEAPGFVNTLEALERSGEALQRVMNVFHHLCASHTSDALQAIEREMAPVLTAHYNKVMLDPRLFARIDALYQQRDTLDLDAESLRLLERWHLDFVRSGARLEGGDRIRYAQLTERLAELHTAFAQNVLAHEKAFAMVLRHEEDLAGLPAFVRSAARQAAAERGHHDADAHVITLSRSSLTPFMTFSTRRDLRKQLWQAWRARGEHAGSQDNRPVVVEILRLRLELARLLGYADYAHYALADTMAATPDAALELLLKVWEPACRRARMERAQMQELAAVQAQAPAIEAHDWHFWAEQVRKAHFAIDEEELKPYLQLERLREAMFEVAQRLFGICFSPLHGFSSYHPSVLGWEVLAAPDRNAGLELDCLGSSHPPSIPGTAPLDTASSGAASPGAASPGAASTGADAVPDHLIGVFLADDFARPSKRSGAWMNCLRDQNGLAGFPQSCPVVVNNNNFSQAAAGAPTLLSLDDARTLFHEFGHGLHGLLSRCRYPRLAGTNVLRDFVEFPSQLLEHWLLQPEILKRYALHVETGEAMPDTLIAKLLKAKTFQQGFATVEYLASALADLRIHRIQNFASLDLDAFEQTLLSDLHMPEAIGLRHRLPHFLHLFAGSGYAAGYYVYLWAEVLDADGFEAFLEAGNIFDPRLASLLHEHVYSAGNRCDPMQAYLRFRGRAPTVEPLLRQRGLELSPAI
jgi:peptidyl-dipeptidase Dcp